MQLYLRKELFELAQRLRTEPDGEALAAVGIYGVIAYSVTPP